MHHNNAISLQRIFPCKTVLNRGLCLVLLLLGSFTAVAQHTLPVKGQLVKPSHPAIQYVGRVSFQNPDSPAFRFPGIQINTDFEGTSVKMLCKPQSGYFMVQIDQAEPFKVAFTGQQDSLVTLATALPRGRHSVRTMYCVEGLDFKPEFRGFVIDDDGQPLTPPALPQRTIEFIGNSITCAYGNEATFEGDHFSYATENHYYGYVQLTARALQATPMVVARSGIGVYRNYNGPKTGNVGEDMPAHYDYTLFPDKTELWDFNRFTPQVVCINLGTNDLSTNNYDLKLFKQAHWEFLQQVRSHYPKAKIVLLCGSMLNGKELEACRQTLDQVMADAHKANDKEVYRFDFTPQDGSLKYGADWHPSIWQHEKMAAELTAYLRTLMQWF